MINPGQLDRRITLQTRTETRGAQGGFTDTWATLAEVHAQFIPRTSRDFRSAQQIHSEAQAAFRIRYRSDLTGSHRIAYANRIWDIIGEPVEEGRRATMLVAARYAEGVTP